MEFTESENPWAPTAAVAEINAQTGSGLELIGLDAQTGGTSSAAYVRWPDGRECALTRTDIPIAWMRHTAEALTVLRAEGLPVPRHDLVLELSDGRLAVVQERLPGRPLNRVDASDIDAMVRAKEQFAGVLANRRDISGLPTFLRLGPIDRARLRSLETYSDRSRSLLGRIREIIQATPHVVTADGLVHPDFGLGNILFDDAGHVSGIVDWNGGAACGDHRTALLKLSINITQEGDGWVQPDAVDRLNDILNASIEPALLRRSWAIWTLRSVSHAVRNGFDPKRIDSTIDLGEVHLA